MITKREIIINIEENFENVYNIVTYFISQLDALLIFIKNSVSPNSKFAFNHIAIIGHTLQKGLSKVNVLTT